MIWAKVWKLPASFVGSGDVLWWHFAPERVEGGQEGLGLCAGEWRDVLAGQDAGGEFRYPLEGSGASRSGQDEGGGCLGVGCEAAQVFQGGWGQALDVVVHQHVRAAQRGGQGLVGGVVAVGGAGP
ncbi:hypothetical protein [Streptomyces sp. NPDC059552]|uniref:hypothetical protein n=1 Tax=Streptomyces sp. NPDC059552 TaxID=3346862 RepID=UPI00369978B7